MGKHKCCIPTCGLAETTVKVFSFPTKPKVSDVWVEILKNKFPSLKFKRDRYGKITSFVCIRHFEAKYILEYNRRETLSAPTLSTSEEISSNTQNSFVLDTSIVQSRITATATINPSTSHSTFSVCHDHDYGVAKKIKLQLSNIGAETVAMADSSLVTSRSRKTSLTAMPVHSRDAEMVSTAGSSLATPSSIYASVSATSIHSRDAEMVSTAGSSLATPGSMNASVSATSIHSRGTKGNTSRNRIVRSVQNLTPRCKKIYRKCIGIINSKRRLVYSFQERLQKAQALSEQQSFKFAVESLPKHTKTFLSMQVKNANKHVKRRRFATEEKLLSLTLLKQSPKGYKLLQKLFILPSRRTLTTFTHDFLMRPGLNQNVLNQLMETVKGWDEKKRACAIVFDEISLTPHLTFIESEDSLSGFVNFGHGSEKKFCDHSLVFMVRGICSSWRQMVAFYFCEGTTPAITLKNILRDVVEGIAQTGLTPMALVCDQGTTFQTCLKSFQADTRRDQLMNGVPEGHKIDVSGHKMNIIYDPPHLIKGIRNNLLTKNLSFCGKTARWEDIVEVYKADCELGEIRMLHKLNDEHVNPTTSQKMKVKICTQVVEEPSLPDGLYV